MVLNPRGEEGLWMVALSLLRGLTESEFLCETFLRFLPCCRCADLAVNSPSNNAYNTHMRFLS